MLYEGETICLYHGGKIKLNNQIYYKTRIKDSDAIVVAERHGTFWNAYEYDPEMDDVASNGRTFRVRDTTYQRGRLTTLSVEYTDGTLEGTGMLQLADKDRICPVCIRHGLPVHLLPAAGTAPTYLISILGESATGKTLFLNSISKNGHCFPSKDYEIKTFFHEEDLEHVGNLIKCPQPSPIKTIDATAIVIRKKGTPIAVVYLSDTAGELSTNAALDSQEASLVENILTRFSDACILTNDPRAINLPELKDYKKDRDYLHGNLSELLDQIHIQDLPTAVTLTGSDRLHDICEKNHGLHTNDGFTLATPSSPLFKNMRLTETNLINHMRLAKDLLQETSSIDLSVGNPVGCFLISSGRDDTKENTRVFDFDQSRNVIYPVAWILNQLGLIKIREE